MTSNFFKLVFLNSLLLCFSANFDPSLKAADNDSEAVAMKDMVELPSEGQHKWLVVGGSKADVKDFPFQAVVVFAKDTALLERTCGGTIISRWHLITSAICVCDLKKPFCPKLMADQFDVFAGSTYRWNLQKDAINHKVEEIRMHPEFNKQDMQILERGAHMMSFKHDLAVIKIKGSFSFNDKVQKINLPDSSVTDNIIQMEKSGMECSVFGWGTTSIAPNTHLLKFVPLQLHYAKLKLITHKSCYNKWFKKGYLIKSSFHVCATGPNKGICLGDNGGGLVCGNGGDKYILGVTSMTYACGSASVPNVFTRVDTSLDFIKKIIGSSDDITKSAQSSGDFIHNQLMAQYYGAPLTSLLLIFVLKGGF